MKEVQFSLNVVDSKNEIKTIKDLSTNDRNGKIIGLGSRLEEKKDGFFQKSLFLPKNNYIEIPSQISLQPLKGLTFSAWLYFEDYTRPYTDDLGNQGIISPNPDNLGSFFDFSGLTKTDSNQSSQLSLKLYFDSSDSGFFVFRVDDPNGKLYPIGEAGHYVSVSASQMPKSTWLHLAAVIESSEEEHNGRLKLFINARLLGERVYENPRNLVGLNLTNNTIGKGIEWNIAYFCLYKAPLSQEEVRKDMLSSLMSTLDTKSLTEALQALDRKLWQDIVRDLVTEVDDTTKGEVQVNLREQNWKSIQKIFNLK